MSDGSAELPAPLLEPRDLRRAGLRGLLVGGGVAGAMALLVLRGGLPPEAVPAILVGHLPIGLAVGLAGLAEGHAGARLRRGARLGPALVEVWAAGLVGLVLALVQGVALGRAVLRQAPVDAPHEALAYALELFEPSALAVLAVAAVPMAVLAYVRWRGLRFRSQLIRSLAATGCVVLTLRAIGPSVQALGGLVLFGLVLPLLHPPLARLADWLEARAWPLPAPPPPPLAGDAGSGCAALVLGAVFLGLCGALFVVGGPRSWALVLVPAATGAAALAAGVVVVWATSGLRLRIRPADGPAPWLEPEVEAAAQADLEAAGYRPLGALTLEWTGEGQDPAGAPPAMRAREVILSREGGPWAAVVHTVVGARPRPVVRAVGAYFAAGPIRRVVVLDRPFDPANQVTGAAPGSILVALPGADLPALEAALARELARLGDPAPSPATLEAVTASELETWGYRSDRMARAPALRLALALLRGPTGGRLVN